MTPQRISDRTISPMPDGPYAPVVAQSRVNDRTKTMARFDPSVQTFMSTFPKAAWLDPITNQRIAFKDLNPTAQRQALAEMGFTRDTILPLTKRLLFRAYARQSQTCLEQKINDQKALNRANIRLRQRLTVMAQTIGLSPNAADVEPDEWYEN